MRRRRPVHETECREVEYLLLGLYDDRERLNYVGRCTIHANARQIAELLQPIVTGSESTGNTSSGKTRWGERKRTPILLKPRLVAEVSTDHIENGRFRHGSRLLRWRDDKHLQSWTLDQLDLGRRQRRT